MSEERIKNAYQSYRYRAERSSRNVKIKNYREFKKEFLHGPKDALGRRLSDWQTIGTKPPGFMYNGERGGSLLEYRFEKTCETFEYYHVTRYQLQKAIKQIEKYLEYAKTYKHKKLAQKIKAYLPGAKQLLREYDKHYA